MKRRKESIQVYCEGNRPVAFQRPRGRTLVIQNILRVWTVQTHWWAQETRCTYYEVVATGGTYCLCKNGPNWRLVGVHD